MRIAVSSGNERNEMVLSCSEHRYVRPIDWHGGRGGRRDVWRADSGSGRTPAWQTPLPYEITRGEPTLGSRDVDQRCGGRRRRCRRGDDCDRRRTLVRRGVSVAAGILSLGRHSGGDPPPTATVAGPRSVIRPDRDLSDLPQQPSRGLPDLLSLRAGGLSRSSTNLAHHDVGR